LDDNTEPG